MAKSVEKRVRKVRVSTVPVDETKEQKFIRLASRRVNKVRKALDQIGLLGASAYVSTEAQRIMITEALRESVEFNLARLNKVKSGKADFKL